VASAMCTPENPTGSAPARSEAASLQSY
jgi:hypothetical protein